MRPGDGDGGAVGAKSAGGAGDEGSEGPRDAQKAAQGASGAAGGVEVPEGASGAQKGAQGREGAPDAPADGADDDTDAGADADAGGDAAADGAADADGDAGDAPAARRSGDEDDAEDEAPAVADTTGATDATDAEKPDVEVDKTDAADKAGKAGKGGAADKGDKGGESGKADEDDAESDKPTPGADADADADADDKPTPRTTQPLDQPTTAFRAVRPTAPAVDQPTTMLKLGDAKPPAEDESPAERTSKFVALKPLDDSPSRKPPAAEGTAVVPQVGPERTTQQPLPPKPPLDLLAELTNTPPPPPTPLRTLARRVKIWTPLAILLVIVFAVVQAVRPLPTPTLRLTAQETVSFEGGKPSVPWPGQGQAAMDVNGVGTFGTSGTQKPVPIASIAKVMTVYVILRDHPLKPGDKGPKIKVDAAAQKHYETGKAENESVVKVTEGQQITEYEALQAVMLPSANNVAKLLARWDSGSGSEDAFVEKMNKTAEELGMKNTTYTDPSGLDKTTVSTADDLVKLGRAAMENPVFEEISKQPSYIDLNGDQQNNFFGLVPTVAIGIKTGTTTAAGGNILFAAEKTVGGKTQTIIGAALGQYGRDGTANIDEVTAVVRRLIEAGQDALTAKTVVKKGDVVGQVDDGLGGTTPVVATKNVTAVGWSGLTVKLELDGPGDGSIPHTAKAGTEVGTLSVGDGSGGSTIEVPVALGRELAEPGFTEKLTRVA
ncbi:D-alanyl-D-alanine carboxypeptidase [Streptomyces sp. NPDC005876]|uniref:D-alanyl-D-alanine carboxypeptidase n=1 Tax=Streptomyces sp. NPDC005876 TaxID=3157076 RepID=UPI0033D1FF58